MIEAAARQNNLSDPRLAALATSAAPAWLWNTDATRVLWANPIGAAILGAQSSAALTADHVAGLAPIAAQITRFSATLPFGGAARLQRLRGLGAGLGRMLLCSCSRIALPDRTPGFLIVAQEPAGPPLTLAERVRRLYQTCDSAVAAFMPDGLPIFTSARARAVIGAAGNLAALGAEGLGREALILGHAAGSTPYGAVSIDRLGRDTTTVLVVTFLTAPAAAVPAPIDVAAHPDEIAAVAPTMSVEAAPTMDSAIATDTIARDTPLAVAPEPVALSPTMSPDLPAEAPADVATTPPPLEIPMAWITSEPASPPTKPDETVAPDAPIKTQIPLRERRHPLRFVWQMDVDGRFTLGSDEFAEVLGPDIALALGRRWDEIAAELALDPDSAVARAVASRDTWSGIVVSWPVDGGNDRLKIELSGLPIYDRNRVFLGYRGFGVCRDSDRVAALTVLRRNGDATVHNDPDMPGPEITSSVAAKIANNSTIGAKDDNRPVFTLVASAKNVVPFRTTTPGADPKGPTLSPSEHSAFNELARQLAARLQDGAHDVATPVQQETAPPTVELFSAASAPADIKNADDRGSEPHQTGVGLTEHPLLERLPVGLLVYRLDHLLYANRAFLEWTGYPNLDALTDAGGLDSLFIETGADALSETAGHGRPLAITTHLGNKIPVEGRLFSVLWDGETALVLMLVSALVSDRQDDIRQDEYRRDDNRKADDRHQEAERALRLAEAEIATLNALLDTTSEGVVVLDRDGRILSANRGAKVLLGYATHDLVGSLSDLFTSESKRMALEHFAALARGETGIVDTGCEATVRTRTGGSVPVLMAMNRIAGDGPKFCVILQDITARKRMAEELLSAQTQWDKAASDKHEFLAKISHEIRTPLNSIVGFSEVMLEERFGPIGNERYRDYLKDIRVSGTHVVSMLNDLLDLSKIETGTLALTFVRADLNELVHSCVTQMQPQASRERIIIRMSLSPSLPEVIADVRSLRQIIINLLDHSIKFTGAGGQVIVSTALSDAREVMLRVRDTGIGMSDKDVEAAIEPFRQPATRSSWSASGSGLGLSLTKALAEANRARFNIISKVDDGTLVEITFPAAPVLRG